MEFRKMLYGFQEKLPKDFFVVVAAFDAATSGRLALAYYNEFGAWDFLERLHHWDKSCCWFNRPFGIQSPDLRNIVHYAFGTLVEKNGVQEFKADDKILPQHVQRLLSCLGVGDGGRGGDVDLAAVRSDQPAQVPDGAGARREGDAVSTVYCERALGIDLDRVDVRDGERVCARIQRDRLAICDLNHQGVGGGIRIMISIGLRALRRAN